MKEIKNPIKIDVSHLTSEQQIEIAFTAFKYTILNTFQPLVEQIVKVFVDVTETKEFKKFAKEVKAKEEKEKEEANGK
jgi:enoyl-[acyl-carrier-protein] reductase (NADH)